MSILGTRVPRFEDKALLTTGGSYVDDITPEGAAHVTFVRSELPHAEIVSIDTSEAKGAPGVIAVFTAADFAFIPSPPSMPMLNQEMLSTPLPQDRVRYVGDPIAVVVTETREQGVDAAELVTVELNPLPPVLDLDEALKNEVLLFPEAKTNVSMTVPSNAGDADPFADCEVVVSLKFRNQRMAPCPIEGRSVASQWKDGHLTQWAVTQGVHGTRDTLMRALGIDKDQIRVITPHVGGAFGAKNGGYPEDICVAQAARMLDRPLHWTETRTENMLGMVHSRGQEYDAKLGGTKDGKLIAYSLGVVQDGGAYPRIGAVLPMLTRIMTSGVYDLEHVFFEAKSVQTTTTPTGAFRGAGRPEATAAIERMIDLYANEIGMDPGELRRRNLLQPSAFPLETPTGAKMDSGEYEKALDAVLETADYSALRAEQARRREAGEARQLGLGLSTYVEITNPLGNQEYGSVEVNPDGTALARTGSSSHGQGHHTTFAMLVHDVTGIPLDQITVIHGDTDRIPRGGGTGGSKSLQLGGSALFQASEEVVAMAKELAADLLEANPDDITLDSQAGTFSVIGTPSVTKSWADIGVAAEQKDEFDLRSEIDFDPSGATFPFGAHLSVVEVDVETGQVSIMRHFACDDAGTMINPLLVEGQVHGGLASGIARRC